MPVGVSRTHRSAMETDLKFADAKRVLPSFYNRTFDKNEKRGRELLQDLLESSPARNKRRRGGST